MPFSFYISSPFSLSLSLSLPLFINSLTYRRSIPIINLFNSSCIERFNIHSFSLFLFLITMISKEVSRLTTIFICMSFLFQYMSGERLPANLLEMNVNNSDDSMLNNYLWLRPMLYADSDESSIDDNNSREMSPLLSKLISVDNEHDQNNRPSFHLSPVRRSNFWKRSNFWRKRANFWRRDLNSQEHEQVM
ncbi:hypothetical protein I4U23_020911 [Adineta vaga]|nr:hypothetical protein I4U23_020911 [Adineta vaga]